MRRLSSKRKSPVTASASTTQQHSRKKPARATNKNQDSESDTQTTFEVESIVNSRIIHGKQQYKLHWKGYPSSEDTWEVESRLSCPDLIREYHERIAEQEGKTKNEETNKTEPSKGQAATKRKGSKNQASSSKKSKSNNEDEQTVEPKNGLPVPCQEDEDADKDQECDTSGKETGKPGGKTPLSSARGAKKRGKNENESNGEIGEELGSKSRNRPGESSKLDAKIEETEADDVPSKTQNGSGNRGRNKRVAKPSGKISESPKKEESDEGEELDKTPSRGKNKRQAKGKSPAARKASSKVAKEINDSKQSEAEEKLNDSVPDNSDEVKNNQQESNGTSGNVSKDSSELVKSKENDEEEDEEEDETEYEVEKILDVANQGKDKRLFLIRWKGYDSSEDTWEPEKNLHCKDLIEAFLADLPNEGGKKTRENPRRSTPFAVSPTGKRHSKRGMRDSRKTYFDQE